jgi:hypothetical protein
VVDEFVVVLDALDLLDGPSEFGLAFPFLLDCESQPEFEIGMSSFLVGLILDFINTFFIV